MKQPKQVGYLRRQSSPRMDATADAASAIAGVLSLTIQVAQLTQNHTSRVKKLPGSVALYLEKLVVLKTLLCGVQDTLLLQSSTPGFNAIANQSLHVELKYVQDELENLHDKLQVAQRHKTSIMVKTLLWPFQDDETIRWANSLGHCKDRIQATTLMSGL